MRYALLALALLAAVPGLVQASTPDSLTVQAGPNLILVERRDVYEGDEAATIRANVDRAGDNDGAVSPDEAAEFERSQTRGMPTSAECWSHLRLVSYGGRSPQRLSAAWDRLEGLAGPAADRSAFTWIRSRTFEFPAAPIRVEARLDQDDLRQLQPSCPMSTSSVSFNVDNGAAHLGFGRATLGANDGHVLLPEKVSPAWAAPASGAIQLDRNAIQRLGAEPLTFEAAAAQGAPAAPGPTRDGSRTWVPLLVLGGLAALVYLRTPSGTWLLLGLFTRLHRHDLLENPHREALHRLIEAEPGASLADLRRATGMSHGTALYHLRTLQRHGLIRMRSDGWRTRFFPAAGPTDTPYLSAHQQRVLTMVCLQPGLSQTELAARLGMPRKTLAHHLARLEQAGRISSQRQGRQQRYLPAQPVLGVTSTGPVASS